MKQNMRNTAVSLPNELWITVFEPSPGTVMSAMEQLESALHAVEIELDDAALARLDEIFPGPGGAAPEAYAW